VEKSSQKLESWGKNFGGEIRPRTSLSDDPGQTHDTPVPIYYNWWRDFARSKYKIFIFLRMVVKISRGQVGPGNVSHRRIQPQQPAFTVYSGAKNLKMLIFPHCSEFFKNSDSSVARVPATSNPTYYPPNMIEKNVMDIKNALDSPLRRNMFQTLQKCTFAL